ncbi:alpha/beta fold hydrolase [Candidatus Solirubrobacter pratensis]|uniref:alpha/beta fold hydrolase n=1 Tax=Candidatus Solirubrobacter pratensis TaxID=1298857 RepID=UPI000425CB11|nr:alpha/beta fold hydrolase [Candidatus Solirubrobacter pratensis]
MDDLGGLAVDAFRSLPARYLGAAPGFDATYCIRLGDIGRSWEVRCTAHGARVRAGATRREPDVVIGTDARTWLDLREGRLSGVEAFSQRRLYARGDLDLAVGFEGLFRLPNGRPPLLRVHDVPVGRLKLSALTMGEGPDILLLHGLGSTKASFFETAAALSRNYRVHALDLPGFGGSSKPSMAPYGAPYAARQVLGAMDAMGIARAHIVGNSMGGRVAIEVGLTRPDRVRGLGLLCPAVAFVRRDWHWLVKLSRPELGMLPHSLGRARIERQFWALFADRDLVDPSVADIVVDEFERIYRSAGARLAFLASARAIYLERAYGRGGFYERLSGLEPPALFVWSSHDRLIPERFRMHVEQALPSAEQVVLRGTGHVPQVERPERTNGLLSRFFARVDALGGARGGLKAA